METQKIKITVVLTIKDQRVLAKLESEQITLDYKKSKAIIDEIVRQVFEVEEVQQA